MGLACTKSGFQDEINSIKNALLVFNTRDDFGRRQDTNELIEILEKNKIRILIY